MHMRRLFWLQMGACSTYHGEYYYVFLWLVCLFFEGFGLVLSFLLYVLVVFLHQNLNGIYQQVQILA